ncbi:MAG: putative bifunctional diguanylate cyclase/phosphodiesterase, partial [Acidimicrobiales bacterium]
MAIVPFPPPGDPTTDGTVPGRFEWRADAMALLGAVAGAANASESPRAALAAAIEQIMSYTHWPVGHAYEVNAGNELVPTELWRLDDSDAASVDTFVTASRSQRLTVGAGLPGRVLLTGAPAWIADVVDDANFPRADAARRAHLRAAFAFAVTTRARVAAVLEFYCHDALEPDERFLEIIGQIGYQLGLVYERELVRVALASSEERTRRILDTAGDAFVGMNADGAVSEWNQHSEAIFGWSRHEALGRQVTDLIVPPASRPAHQHGLARFLATGEPHILGQRLEVTALHRVRGEFPIELTLWALPHPGGWEFYAFARDITERKQIEDELSHLAAHDELTGLPNRRSLLEDLRRGLAEEDRSAIAVLFIDLDHFKLINDSLGHDVGDSLLLSVTDRLRSSVRPNDTVGRLSGDEFLVVCRHVSDRACAELVAERIRRTLAQPVHLNGEKVRVSASIGVALAGEQSDAEALMRDADAAMYHAKAQGRGRLEVFNEGMRQGALTRLRLERDLESALDEGQLRLHYQPVVALASGRIEGVEALLRWEHPEHGLLLPDRFIPAAEDTGLIVPVGAWVLAEAARQAATWRDQGLGPLQMAVNLSGRQLAQSDVSLTVARAVRDVVEPDLVQLCLEITESVLMSDPEESAATLRDLRKVGVRLAIDDFGTGYSSLAYLR